MSSQKNGQHGRHNGRYRDDILRWAAWERRIQKGAFCQDIGVSLPTFNRALDGKNLEIDSLWQIVDGLKLKRSAMTDFKLKARDFSQAVLNGNRG